MKMESRYNNISKNLANYSVTEGFVDQKIVTLVYNCLHCIKNKRSRSSIKEMEQAAYTIGLLVMITSCDDKSHEAYEDVFSAVSKGLNSKLDTVKVLECLTIVTYFGANDPYETEQAMQFIWTFIQPQSISDFSSNVLTAAISAWSILLSAINEWNASCTLWKGAISRFSSLVNNNDGNVAAAAFEALALIYDTNVSAKFSTCVKDSNGSVHENAKNELKNVIKQVKSRFPYLKNHPQRKILTCSQIIQMKYMIHFLGKEGFAQHMIKNEKFHNIFNFIPETTTYSNSVLSAPEEEDVKVLFFQPSIPLKKECRRSNKYKQIVKRMTMSSNSSLSKARTQFLRKKRMVLAQERGEDSDSWGLEESY